MAPEQTLPRLVGHGQEQAKGGTGTAVSTQQKKSTGAAVGQSSSAKTAGAAANGQSAPERDTSAAETEKEKQQAAHSGTGAAEPSPAAVATVAVTALLEGEPTYADLAAVSSPACRTSPRPRYALFFMPNNTRMPVRGAGRTLRRGMLSLSRMLLDTSSCSSACARDSTPRLLLSSRENVHRTRAKLRLPLGACMLIFAHVDTHAHPYVLLARSGACTLILSCPHIPHLMHTCSPHHVRCAPTTVPTKGVVLSPVAGAGLMSMPTPSRFMSGLPVGLAVAQLAPKGRMHTHSLAYTNTNTNTPVHSLPMCNSHVRAPNNSADQGGGPEYSLQFLLDIGFSNQHAGAYAYVSITHLAHALTAHPPNNSADQGGGPESSGRGWADVHADTQPFHVRAARGPRGGPADGVDRSSRGIGKVWWAMAPETFCVVFPFAQPRQTLWSCMFVRPHGQTRDADTI